MAKRVCVLFSGNMGAGKDTAANMLADVCRERGVSSFRIAFADPIKDIAASLLGVPKEVSYGTQQDKLDYIVYGKTVRHWHQWIGTEMGRQQVHTDVWVHRFAERALASDASVVIGVDCRFLNEMMTTGELLSGKMDLYFVRIVNPRVPLNLEHQSESEVHAMNDSLFHYVIHNTKGLDYLRSNIENFADGVLNRIS